jgi:hypothetical protein
LQTDLGIGQLFSLLMQISALLCRSGFNDLELIQAKWLLILLRSEDAPWKPELPGHMLLIRADGLILATFLVHFRVIFFSPLLYV